MGPLSAVAVAVSFLILAMTWLTWITASATTLGWIFFIAAIVVLVDTFWSHFGSTLVVRRGPPPQ